MEQRIAVEKINIMTYIYYSLAITCHSAGGAYFRYISNVIGEKVGVRHRASRVPTGRLWGYWGIETSSLRLGAEHAIPNTILSPKSNELCVSGSRFPEAPLWLFSVYNKNVQCHSHTSLTVPLQAVCSPLRRRQSVRTRTRRLQFAPLIKRVCLFTG